MFVNLINYLFIYDAAEVAAVAFAHIAQWPVRPCPQSKKVLRRVAPAGRRAGY